MTHNASALPFPIARTTAPVIAVAAAESAFDLVDVEAPNLTSWVTLDQHGGRGRLGRSWQTPANTALAAVTLVRPSSLLHVSWLPLLGGLAVQRAIAGLGGEASVKWPNDVLIHGKKVSGILAELRGGVIALGYGINLTQTRSELPVDTATSLALEGVHGEAAELADTVLAGVLRVLQPRIEKLGTEELADEVLAVCSTIGESVKVQLPDGELRGVATGLAADGGLIVAAPDGKHIVNAGDIVHLRSARP